MHTKTKHLGLNFLNILYNLYETIATENKILILDRLHVGVWYRFIELTEDSVVCLLF